MGLASGRRFRRCLASQSRLQVVNLGGGGCSRRRVRVAAGRRLAVVVLLCRHFIGKSRRRNKRKAARAAFCRALARAQASMSAQMFLAQPSAILPSSSLRAAETPPAPLTGWTVLVAASYWCTEATWMTLLLSTKL